MSLDPTWSFSAQIERYDVDTAWHYLAIPAEHVDAVREAGEGRYVITMNDAVTWHCGLLPTGEGRWAVAVAKTNIKAAQTTFGLGQEQIRHANPRGFAGHARQRP